VSQTASHEIASDHCRCGKALRERGVDAVGLTELTKPPASLRGLLQPFRVEGWRCGSGDEQSMESGTNRLSPASKSPKRWGWIPQASDRWTCPRIIGAILVRRPVLHLAGDVRRLGAGHASPTRGSCVRILIASPHAFIGANKRKQKEGYFGLESTGWAWRCRVQVVALIQNLADEILKNGRRQIFLIWPKN